LCIRHTPAALLVGIPREPRRSCKPRVPRSLSSQLSPPISPASRRAEWLDRYPSIDIVGKAPEPFSALRSESAGRGRGREVDRDAGLGFRGEDGFGYGQRRPCKDTPDPVRRCVVRLPSRPPIARVDMGCPLPEVQIARGQPQKVADNINAPLVPVIGYTGPGSTPPASPRPRGSATIRFSSPRSQKKSAAAVPLAGHCQCCCSAKARSWRTLPSIRTAVLLTQ